MKSTFLIESAFPNCMKRGLFMQEQRENNETSDLSIHNTKEQNKQISKRDIVSMLVYIGSVIVLALLLNTFVIQKVQVEGSSMYSTLHDNDQLLLEKMSYRFSDPQRFDIVIFHPVSEAKGKLYIKRVIGLPGETIQIKDGLIYINGKQLEESYGLQEISDPGIASDPIVIGTNEYFVLGDNREASDDSRKSWIGLISRDSIAGKAVYRIWPFSRFGKIN